jgi:hypothetical protein
MSAQTMLNLKSADFFSSSVDYILDPSRDCNISKFIFFCLVTCFKETITRKDPGIFLLRFEISRENPGAF